MTEEENVVVGWLDWWRLIRRDAQWDLRKDIADALEKRADEMQSKMEYVAESELDRAADLIAKGELP